MISRKSAIFVLIEKNIDSILRRDAMVVGDLMGGTRGRQIEIQKRQKAPDGPGAIASSSGSQGAHVCGRRVIFDLRRRGSANLLLTIL